MDRRLRKYVTNRAKYLDRTYTTIDAGDLVNDAWLIYLTCENVGESFRRIRRHFNKIKMRAIREAKRAVPLEYVENTLELSENPEDGMITAVDLEGEIKDFMDAESGWKKRVARGIAEEYRDA